MYCFLPSDFTNVITFVINPLVFIQHSLGQIWSTQVRYVTIGVADLS